MTDFHYKSVLLIDDDTIGNLIHSIFIRTLDLDVKVETVTNGVEAMELLTQPKTDLARPTLLVLGIRMPVMNGWKFLEAFDGLDAAVRNELAIVVLTISENEMKLIKAMKHPSVKAVLRKPLSEEKFTRLAKRLSVRNKRTQ